MMAYVSLKPVLSKKHQKKKGINRKELTVFRRTQSWLAQAETDCARAVAAGNWVEPPSWPK